MSTVEFELSDIGEGLEEAEIIRWLVTIGDQVQRDQPIVEVMTDKSNAELPAPVAGTIVSVGGEVGDIVRVGETLAVIDPDADAQASAAPVSTFQATAPAPLPIDEPSPARPPAPATTTGGRPKASPSTRREAARRGIDLATISGSGPGGRILASDLDSAPIDNRHQRAGQATAIADDTAPHLAEEQAADTPSAAAAPIQRSEQDQPQSAIQPAIKTAIQPTAPATSEEPRQRAELGNPNTVPLRGVRRAIARNMHRSWSEIPHIHAFEHFDAEPLLELRSQLRESGRAAFESITPLTLLVAAVASAMDRFPEANATLDLEAETITQHGSVNIGIAVAAPQGLVVPVIRDASELSLTALALEFRRLVDGARAGTLERTEFTGGTVTITNFGSLGGEQALPLIRPPESVIFGFGSIALRPFVIDGEVVARKTMNAVLGADHRLLDGDVATGLLTHVTSALVAPINLALGS